MKTREEYIDILKSHSSEFKDKFGIDYMCVFGSVARNQHHVGSDIDVFVVMPPKAYAVCEAEYYIEDLLGVDVDLIRYHKNMRPFFLEQIKKDGITILGTA